MLSRGLMHSFKEITITVTKPENYEPIANEEKERIISIVSGELFELAERFDGVCDLFIRIEIEGVGNA